MKYIIAVSGGVDSVVLLDMVAKKHPAKDLLVAHFEHGIRGAESEADARFVEALSKKYGLLCKVGYGNLGKTASEADAREKRYEFLHNIASSHKAKLITAHHQDDLLETIALNIERGTGWRGLTPFSDERIVRPLVGRTKASLYEYALSHDLEWVEDQTNASDVYTRNRLRKRMHKLSETEIKKILALHSAQRTLRNSIETESKRLLPFTQSRYFLTMVDSSVAGELLRTCTHGILTRPQLDRLLLAIKTATPGSMYQAGGGITAQFTSREVVVTR